MALLAVVPACGGPRPCTLIGAEPGVEFRLDGILAGASGPVRATGCVEAYCVTRTFDATSVPLFIVDNPGIRGPREVLVGLRVTGASGRRIFDASTRVRLHRVQPNGPGCPPTVYAATVTATTSGELRPQ